MSAFGALEELRHRPIGDQAAARAARKGFRSRIPIARDNALFGEAVVEARDAGLAGENFYASDRNPPYWQRVEGATDKLWLRQSVAEKLARVNARAARGGAGAVSVRCLAAARGAGLFPRRLDAARIEAPRSAAGRRGAD